MSRNSLNIFIFCHIYCEMSIYFLQSVEIIHGQNDKNPHDGTV